jgi:hypothetical protein
MPKVQPVRRNRAQNSTAERRARADRVKEKNLEMPFRCKRCEEKNLRCFVDTASGRCAGCISVSAACSLFVTEEEWEKVQREKREKRLELARIEEEAARVRRELLEVEAREHSYADRDLAILNFQDRAKEQAEGDSAPGTDLLATEPSLPGSSTDLGWLQADASFDPFSDYFLSLEDPVLASLGVSGGTQVPVTCSSSNFLLVPKCSGFLAILAT